MQTCCRVGSIRRLRVSSWRSCTATRDYAERDAQFSRIAGAMQRLFPQQVVATAVALARLHALTEELDHAMGKAWLAPGADDTMPAHVRYVQAWRTVGAGLSVNSSSAW